MAQTKKTGNTGKKANTNGKKSSSKKKNTKKPATKKPTKKEIEQARLDAERKRKESRRQRVAVLIFFTSCLLFFLSGVKGGSGSLYNRIHTMHLGIWGFSAFIFPVISIIFSYFLSKNREGSKPWIPYLWSLVLLSLISQFFYVLLFENFENVKYNHLVVYEYYNLDTKCGAFAAIFGAGVYLICKSRFVCAILYAILILLIFCLLSKTSIHKLMQIFGIPVKKIGKATEKAVIRHRETVRRQEELRRPMEREVYDRPKERPKNHKEHRIEHERMEMPHDLPYREEKRNGTKEQKEKTPFHSIFEESEQPLKSDKKEKSEDKIEKNSLVSMETEKEPIPVEIEEEAESIGVDEFEQMFSTVNAMEKASLLALAEEEASDLDSPLPKENISTGKASEGEGKLHLSQEEFDSAKQEVTNQIEGNAQMEQVPAYELPPIQCLNKPTRTVFKADHDELKRNAEKLIEALASFKVEGTVEDIIPGPSVTRYEVQPAEGVRINKFTNLSDDLTLRLAASASVRIEAPIPNKSVVGIEIPNKDRISVYMRELIDTEEFKNAKSKLTVALGKDISGKGIYIDLAEMPHLLVAGTTGSGKSVCLNSMIVSILYHAKPSEVKLILIDPKTVEFSVYNDIPHLLVPVVNDPRKAAGVLGWAVTEMLNRYKILNDHKVKNITAYNKLCDSDSECEKLPQIVIFIDELSDLMSVAPSEVEDSICRLAQMARAAGMHLVLATQRPSVDVITGLIKANIPSRIALAVSSQIDSRTILDASGAENLLGNGDMLVAPTGKGKPIRVQGCYISDKETEAVVDFVKTQQLSVYDESIQDEIDHYTIPEKKKVIEKSSSGSELSDEDLMILAPEFFFENPKCCTISALQRKFRLGFPRAARVMDMLKDAGIVRPYDTGDKIVMQLAITKAEWEQMQATSSTED